jgi:biotin carboxyl carrier protein
MKANVNGKKSFEVTAGSEGISVDGVRSSISYEYLGNNRLLMREGALQYEVEIIHVDAAQKKIEVSVKGNVYAVELRDAFDQLLDQLGMGAGKATVQSKVKAPMPGLVLDVLVAPGQVVAKDEPLLILEAMKMENVIKSPRDGEIKSIGVVKGNAIEKNTLLVEFAN